MCVRLHVCVFACCCSAPLHVLAAPRTSSKSGSFSQFGLGAQPQSGASWLFSSQFFPLTLFLCATLLPHFAAFASFLLYSDKIDFLSVVSAIVSIVVVVRDVVGAVVVVVVSRGAASDSGTILFGVVF